MEGSKRVDSDSSVAGSSPPRGETLEGWPRRRWRAAGARIAQEVLVVALFVGITYGMFFELGAANGRPAVADLDDVLLVASPDGPLVIWILSWSAHALRHQPARLFDANMFHPVESSLAYTESMAPLAPLWALLLASTGTPVLALNLLLLLLTVLNAWGGYLLARWLTGRIDAGILGGALLAFNGYASAQRMHLQLQVMFLVPIALLLLFRWLEEREWLVALLLALVSAVLAVTVVYYGMIFAIMVGVVLAGYLAAKRRRPDPRFIGGLVTICLVATVLVAPFATAYLQVPHTGGSGALPAHHLNPIDLVTPSVGSVMHRWLEAIGPPRSEEHRHFPGFLAIGLGAMGLVFVVRGDRRSDRPFGVRHDGRDWRLYALLLALAGGLLLVLSFGPAVPVLSLPYRIFVEALPGFGRIRVPSRLASGTLLAGSVLAAVGYARWTARLWRPGPPGRRFFAVSAAIAVTALTAVENASQTRLFPIPVTAEEALINRALAKAPPGAVLELPIATGVGVQAARMEAKRFMLSTIDWRPRVNGYSGGYPDGYFERAAELARFPTPRALRWICELEVRYVVLRVADPASHPRLTPREARGILSRMPLRARWEEHGGDYLIDMGDWLAWRAGQCPAPSSVAKKLSASALKIHETARPPAPLPRRGGRAPDELHHQGSRAVALFEAEDRSDVGVVELGEELRLAFEAGGALLVGGDRRPAPPPELHGGAELPSKPARAWCNSGRALR